MWLLLESPAAFLSKAFLALLCGTIVFLQDRRRSLQYSTLFFCALSVPICLLFLFFSSLLLFCWGGGVFFVPDTMAHHKCGSGVFFVFVRSWELTGGKLGRVNEEEEKVIVGWNMVGKLGIHSAVKKASTQRCPCPHPTAHVAKAT